MMRHLCLLAVWIAPGELLVAAEPVVELTIVSNPRAPLTAGHEWVRMIAKLKGVRPRVAPGRSAATPAVKQGPSSVRITGVINGSNQLVVPGKRFSLRQSAVIQTWIDDLRKSSTNREEPDRFGLSTDNLKRVHDQLKRVVRFSTVDQPATEVMAQIARRCGISVRLSTQSRSTLDARKVTQELEGMTSGTAMAIVLRSAELVFVPKVATGRIQLDVIDEDRAAGGWPVGWESELKREALVPKIFDMLEIEVSGTPITAVLTAVQGRLETPFFLDEALFRAVKIDPATVKVNVPSGRMSYSNLLRRAIYQAKMKSELRVDERGKAFYWVSPTVPRSRR